MPAISKIAPTNERFMIEEVPNATLENVKTIISTCKLCLQPFFDPSPTGKACHLLGIPGSASRSVTIVVTYRRRSSFA
jgi:hypothetical protein